MTHTQTDDEWRDRAACLGLPSDLFFPDDSGSNSLAEGAKAVCVTCPVLHECREWALEHERKYGVAGGMTPNERQREWRRRQAWPRRDAPFAELVMLADRLDEGRAA